jgi:hypothetical protein
MNFIKKRGFVEGSYKYYCVCSAALSFLLPSYPLSQVFASGISPMQIAQGAGAGRKWPKPALEWSCQGADEGVKTGLRFSVISFINQPGRVFADDLLLAAKSAKDTRIFLYFSRLFQPLGTLRHGHSSDPRPYDDYPPKETLR